MTKWHPRYSGPNRSGICVCGHTWDTHHLGCVLNVDYAKATGEAYVPQECEEDQFEGYVPPGGCACGHYKDSLA